MPKADLVEMKRNPRSRRDYVFALRLLIYQAFIKVETLNAHESTTFFYI